MAYSTHIVQFVLTVHVTDRTLPTIFTIHFPPITTIILYASLTVTLLVAVYIAVFLTIQSM